MREFALVWLTGALCTGAILDAITPRSATPVVWLVALVAWPAVILNITLKQ